MWLILAIGASVFAALTSILAKVGIEGVNSNLATAIRTFVVLVMAWGMVFLTDAQGGIGAISRRSWLFLILSLHLLKFEILKVILTDRPLSTEVCLYLIFSQNTP